MSEESTITTETTAPNDAPADATQAGEASALGAAATEGEETASAGEPEVTDKTETETEAEPGFLGAPEQYDPEAFDLGEGAEFDAEMFDLVKDDLKAMDISQEGAGKLIGMFGEKVVPKIEERMAAHIENQAKEISAQLSRDLEADPEVGGVKLKESQALAAKAIAHAIPDTKVRVEFSKFLEESGLGNHPLLMRVISAGGRALGEASTPQGETVTEKSTTQKFYNRS